MSSHSKEAIRKFCIEDVLKRIDEIEAAVELAQEALVSDTKGSAGDKYETSREMLQQDLTRLTNQYVVAKEDYALLTNLESAPKKIIGLGSLVLTNVGVFYVAVGMGKLEIEQQVYYAISPNAPLAIALIGKKCGEEVPFNQKIFKIENIL